MAAQKPTLGGRSTGCAQARSRKRASGPRQFAAPRGWQVPATKPAPPALEERGVIGWEHVVSVRVKAPWRLPAVLIAEELPAETADALNRVFRWGLPHRPKT